jgi:hypothetical protein
MIQGNQELTMSSKAAHSVDNLVLGTVNASLKWQIDAETLAGMIIAGQVDAHLPHLATFYAEVSSGLILAFAAAHGIDDATLRNSYALVEDRTGEVNLSLEGHFLALQNTYRRPTNIVCAGRF